MRRIRAFVLIVFIIAFALPAWAATENLDEMIARKTRQTSAVWGFSYLEDSTNYYTWQPETLSYTDLTTGREVWVVVRAPDQSDIYSKEYGNNTWSADGSRIGFFSLTRGTANPSVGSSYNYRCIVNTDGSGLKASEGYGRRDFPFDGFGWANTENAYYAFGSGSGEGSTTYGLYKMTPDSNNVVSGSLVLDTSTVDTVKKEIVKSGISGTDRWIAARGLGPGPIDADPNNSINSYEMYFIGLDGSPVVDYYWGVGRNIVNFPGHSTTASEQRFHDVFLLGPSADWLFGIYSGSSDIWATFKVKNGHASDSGPLFQAWNGSSWGTYDEVRVESDGGSTLDNPYGVPYLGHPSPDRWGRYAIVGTYTDCGSPACPGTRIWDARDHDLESHYVMHNNRYDGQHHSWTGWTDYVVAVRPDNHLTGPYAIFINKWDQNYTNQINVASVHHPGYTGNYNGYPRPSQSPDGTKVAFSAVWLNNGGDNNPYISYAVAYHPHPPQITQASASGGTVTVRFDWRLNQPNPRGYTTRGWPDEATNIPPAPREVKKFQLWRSGDNGGLPDGNWIPLGTVDHNIFTRFDFRNGGFKTGQNSYWEISDTPGDGTWYYAVTSIEHSGLESRTLSNYWKVDVSGGSMVNDLEVSPYPNNPGGVSPFWTTNPPAPSNFTATKQSTVGHYLLTWTEPPGSYSKVRYYNIYYSTTTTPPADRRNRIASVPVGTSRYLDWNAHPSAPGYYTITSVDTQGNEGSNPAPAAPTNLSIISVQ